MPSLTRIAVDAAAQSLEIFGAFHPAAGDGVPEGTGTLVLLGPHEPGFWAAFSASAEYLDGAADPLDRWSARVIGTLAQGLGATALFPFGGPPFQPFIGWALKSGRAWVSPVGLLVHDTAGLMVSYRGALAFPDRLSLPQPVEKPCETCAGQPCLSACPVDALGPSGYDVPACKGYLDTDPGAGCQEGGCLVRRACPVSGRYGRLQVQSAFHMRAFHR